MTFAESVRTCLRQKYATFSGRASRSEFWWFNLFYLLVFFVLGVVLAIGFGSSGEEPGALGVITMIVLGVVFLGLILPVLSVTVRRIHDLGYSGWWYLAYLVLTAVPYLGVIVAIAGLVFACMRGTAGPNKFGEDPLNPHGNLQEVFG